MPQFGFTRCHSDYLIAGAEVVENLQQVRTIHSQNQFPQNLRTTHSQILPTKLEQIKSLIGLEPDEQRQVWHQAVEKANGENRTLSQSRVVCDNAFAGVKRYSAVSAVYRNRIEDFDDHLMLTAAGLWNFYRMVA